MLTYKSSFLLNITIVVFQNCKFHSITYLNGKECASLTVYIIYIVYLMLITGSKVKKTSTSLLHTKMKQLEILSSSTINTYVYLFDSLEVCSFKMLVLNVHYSLFCIQEAIKIKYQ